MKVTPPPKDQISSISLLNYNHIHRLTYSIKKHISEILKEIYKLCKEHELAPDRKAAKQQQHPKITQSENKKRKKVNILKC